MARTNQSEIAVLGALSVMPMTGYAVREAIRDVLGHFWSESFGQIYPMLEALDRRRHVVRREARRTGASTFELTGSGRARLVELLAQPIQHATPRDGLLLRLFFGRHLGVDACRALLAEARAEATHRLGEYQTIREGIMSEEEHVDDRPWWLLTVSAGEHGARATIAWVDACLEALDAIAASVMESHT